ncbi:MAG: zinc-ribbon domain-containing protein [Roseovarius sp.]
MRLICPNCGAQYEVPAEVIPETGRDVQCSDCGTTWFQHHPDHEPDSAGDDAPDETLSSAQEPTPAETPSGWPEDSNDYGSEEDDAEYDDKDLGPPAAIDGGTDEDAPTTTPAGDRKRREIDPSVADVLREEAERESRARAQDHRGTVETQQDLGLQDTANDAQRRSEEARARMARLRGEPEAQKTDAEVDEIDPSSRSNLLPDIDEINSSLDSDGKKEEPRPIVADPEMQTAPRKSGFRAGFRIAIVLAVLGLALYVFAPQLADAVPQLAQPLAVFVDTVNGWRADLDSLIRSIANSLTEGGASDG